MNRWICGPLLLATCSAALAQPVDRDIAPFVRDDMHVVSRVNGDVTGDGVADTILVLADKRNREATVIVLGRRVGRSLTDRRQAELFEAIDAVKLALSPLGAPTLKVSEQILTVEHTTGGSALRMTSAYRYRADFQAGRMRLIAIDAKRTSSTMTVQLSWDALTGAQILKKDDGPETKTTYKPGKFWMGETPTGDALIDRALAESR